jgi:hypothetical protein
MVCMALRMSPRIPIQKNDLWDFFRRTNPGTRKSSSKLLVAYMRRAVATHIAPSQLTRTCQGGCSEHPHSFSSYSAWRSCLRARSSGGDCLKYGPCPGTLPARLATLAPQYYVNSGIEKAGSLAIALCLRVSAAARRCRACRGHRSPVDLSICGHRCWHVNWWLCQLYQHVSEDALSSTRACALTWWGFLLLRGVGDAVGRGVTAKSTCHGPQLGEHSGGNRIGCLLLRRFVRLWCLRLGSLRRLPPFWYFLLATLRWLARRSGSRGT